METEILLKDDGNKRNSKNSKKNNFDKKKLKRIKCDKCRNMILYSETDIVRMKSGTKFIICTMCDMEVEIK